MRNWAHDAGSRCAPMAPADADLPGALRHRHQHDVHDADAAHHQGDGGDAAQHQGDHGHAAGSESSCHWLSE